MRLSVTLFALTAFAAAEEQLPSTSSVEQTPSDETLVVTADRQPTTKASTTASVTVLDADDDRQAGHAKSWTERLRRTPGVDLLSRAGGLDGGGLPGIRLRGTQSNADTQVLVDGIPWNDATGLDGDPSLLSLQPAGIERIEVVRGAQSGLYGSRAVGGVVNLISDRPGEEHHGRLRLDGGSFNTLTADAAASGPLLRGESQRPLVGYAVGVSAMDSDGFSATTLARDGDPQGYEDDGLRRLGGNGRIEVNPNDATSLYAAAWLGAADHDFDDGSPDDTSAKKEEEMWRGATGGTLALPLDSILAVDLAHTRGRRETVSGSGFGNSYLRSEESYGSGRWSVPVGAMLTVTPGIDVLHQQANGAGVNNEHQRSLGAWLQGLLAGESWEASAVVRHEQVTGGDSPTTYRVGAALMPWQNLFKLHAAVGTAFRAPSLYQRFVNDGFTVGNPDLEAQRSLSWEVGIDAEPADGLRLGSTLFATEYDNRIAYFFNPVTFIGTYRNETDTSQTLGLENQVNWAIPQTPCAAFATYTWQDTEDQNGQTFIGLPRHKGSLGVTADNAWGWATLAADGVGARRDSNNANLPGYVTCSAVLGWRTTSWLSLYARGENLLDKAHTDANGFSSDTYTSQPLSVFVGAEATY